MKLSEIYKEHIEEFLKHVENKSEWEELIENSLNKKELFERFFQSIINYTYTKENHMDSRLKFLFYCISIEAYYNFNKRKYGNSTQTFAKFFKNLSETKKELIEQKFKVTSNKQPDKSYSKADILKKFPRYIYEERSDFVHQGIHFGLNSSTGFLTYFREQENNIDLELTIEDFEQIYLDGLYNNLKKEVENIQ
ncbi:MAG: hypothetical protein ACMXX7_00265 [Candidatus Woesearchaeota archaeon]